MTTQGVNPSTGERVGLPVADTTEAELAKIVERAWHARSWWRHLPDEKRAVALEAVAQALCDEREPLAEIADSETALGVPRLIAEVERSAFQFSMFAHHVRSGSAGRVEVDTEVAGPPPAGHSELQRHLTPLGVVAVFAASNFPFAFSVCGGDTASALASGCPAIVKAHPSHPSTSNATAEIISSALESQGVPRGVFAVVHGMDTGRRLVEDPRVRAVAFTGSQGAGHALQTLTSGRIVPIPFYGELGSVNPVVVTQRALADLHAFAEGYLDSLTLGAGQFCTNPGLLLVPAGVGVAQVIGAAISHRSGAPLLSAGIRGLLAENLERVLSLEGSCVLGEGTASPDGFRFRPTLIEVPMRSALDDPATLTTECFGPVGLVVEYADLHQAAALLRELPGCLVGAVHAHHDDDVSDVIDALAQIAGRIVWNAWPTGVAVSPAQHHGGPPPSSTSILHTSVGTHAIDRFLRPITYQGFPSRLLPRSSRRGHQQPSLNTA